MLIVHAGMHKTGSSSIQETFFGLRRNGVSYFNPGRKNHGVAFEALTNPDAENNFAFRQLGISGDRLTDMKRETYEKFDAFLRELSGIGIFSAEAISLPQDDGRIIAFRDILAQFDLPLRVVMYLRSPHSFMESAFQQRVKAGGLGRIEPLGLWPQYRKRVERLDQAFGQDRVELRMFDPSRFPQGDVVRDFAELVGVTLQDHEIRRVNEGLSAEAVALIYFQRKFGGGLETEGPGRPARNERWVQALNGIGRRKLGLSDNLLAPAFERHRADLDWIEGRIGSKLVDPASKDRVVIDSEGDLLDLAADNLKHVQRILAERLRETEFSDQAPAVGMLELLRTLA
ncbi:sulfotransferase family protein [Paracoccus zeaxanthinifaciens]|uniref:sulfotransferase family protein n=1 Tax=Paracoccus zeaxanthinifaciens TaxID=187400 RepID=UPI0003B3F7F8|nr:sulfotransferase family protein [Paracoccus zeaxanthinifaciens]